MDKSLMYEQVLTSIKICINILKHHTIKLTVSKKKCVKKQYSRESR